MKRVIVLITLVFLALSCKTNINESSTTSEENNKVFDSDTVKTEKRVILCFGNSLTAGYGLEKEQAYPAILQGKLDSLGYDFQVINSGVSGETTSGGLGRLDWALKQKIDVFILELGANDGLRGIPTHETEKNLEDIILKVKEKSPGVKVLLAGMKVPPNMGGEYGVAFEKMFPTVAKKTEVSLIPFFLDGIAGKPELNQADGIHPTEDGVKIVVENVLQILEPIIN